MPSSGGGFSKPSSFIRFPGALALFDGLTEEILDLAIDAAQFLSRHGLDRGGNRRIEAQQE